MATVQWGDVAGWVGGIGTVAAFAATVWLLFQQNRTLREQGEQLRILRVQERDRQEDRRSEQAKFVSAWASNWQPLPRMAGALPPDPLADTVESGVVVRIRNASEEPVWNVGLMVWSHWGVEAKNVFTPLQLIPPGETRVADVTIALPKEMSISPPVELVFTDAAGRHWHRDAEGRLETPEGKTRPSWATWPKGVPSEPALSGRLWRGR